MISLFEVIILLLFSNVKIYIPACKFFKSNVTILSYSILVNLLYSIPIRSLTINSDPGSIGDEKLIVVFPSVGFGNIFALKLSFNLNLKFKLSQLSGNV